MTLTRTDASRLTIAPVPVPKSLDAPDAGPFLDMVRLANESCLAEVGHDDLREEPEEVLGFWHDQADWISFGYTARRDGAVVGAVKAHCSAEEGKTTLEFDLLIHPDHWADDVAAALLTTIEREARERSRTTVQTWTVHRPDAPGPRVAPSTGWGSIPALPPTVQFLQRNGFSLEQVERNSAFDLSGDGALVERMLAEAIEKAGPEYRVVHWVAPTPVEHRDGFARIISRMSTDAPQGGLVIEEEHWDAERVVRRDARMRASGLTVSVVAVEHIPTGVLAAYNELTIGESPTAVTAQYGTLVLKEHRGRRLGTIVKCANLLEWPKIAPASPRVSTFNAEENRHMLDINEAIGFVPISYAGAWKKTLSP